VGIMSPRKYFSDIETKIAEIMNINPRMIGFYARRLFVEIMIERPLDQVEQHKLFNSRKMAPEILKKLS